MHKIQALAISQMFAVHLQNTRYFHLVRPPKNLYMKLSEKKKKKQLLDWAVMEDHEIDSFILKARKSKGLGTSAGKYTKMF